MNYIITALTIIISSLVPVSVLAAGSATMTFEQTAMTLPLGQTVDVTIKVDPKGEALDTARTILTFDPTILKVESVVRVGAFDRSTPGNVIDNINGQVSWGGFTLDGPVNSVGTFLKISFSGRQVGSSNVAFSNESKLISGGEEKINVNALNALNALNIVVQEALVSDPNLSVVTVSSTSHPQEFSWYAQSTVEMQWIALKGDSDVVSYYYAFDQNSNTNPTSYLSATETAKTFSDVQDGIHYFHLKGIEQNGKSTSTIHRRVQIDTVNPNPIAITVSTEQLIEGESLWLTFATTDDVSGVEQYKVAINTSEFLPQQSPLEITDLVPGTYFFRVAALDRAGNVTNQGQSIRVYPTGTQLDRAEGFTPTNEIDAISQGVTQTEIQKTQSPKLLITLALVLAIGFGTIYVIKKQKIK